ncbi:hypothetical protein JCM12214_28730 [Geobacillus vulcani]
MSFQPDDTCVLVPGVSVITSEEELILINSKYRASLHNIFSKETYINLCSGNGVRFSDLIENIKTSGYNYKDSIEILNNLIEYDFLAKKNSYLEAKTYHKKTSYDFLPKGIRLFQRESSSKQIVEGIQLDETIKTSIINILEKRKSIRKFKKSQISYSQLSTILWAMYGKNKKGHRVVSSAGDSYEITLYLLVNESSVEQLDKGIYRFEPETNCLVFIDKFKKMDDFFITRHIDYSTANFSIILTGDLSYICDRYYGRGYRYLLIESGLILQNAQLVGHEIGIGSTIIGGVNESEINNKLELGDSQIVISGMVFGSNEEMDN